jgi:tRNA(fMet)-specific endonuclease VapC
VVLGCDVGSAQRYGEIKDQLSKKGRPIPENDIWVAAVALQYDLTLVSRDEHFGLVPGLRAEAWQDL